MIYEGIHLRNGIYQIGTRDPLTGKRSRISTKTRDREEALALLEQHRSSPPPPKTLLCGVLDEYLSVIAPEDGSYRRGLISMSRRIETHFGLATLPTLTREHISSYLTAMGEGWEPSTYNLELTRLRAFFKFCVAEGLVEKDPTARLKKRKQPDPTPIALGEVERERLLACCDDEIRPLITFALETGMRVGTVLSLRREDVQHVSGVDWLAVDGGRMKSGRDFRVPLSFLASTLTPHLPFRIPYRRLLRLFKQAARGAGVPTLKIHHLRGTFINTLARRGVPLETVMSLTDHTDIRVVLKYYRTVSTEEKIEALRSEEDHHDQHAQEVPGVSKKVLLAIRPRASVNRTTRNRSEVRKPLPRRAGDLGKGRGVDRLHSVH